jgi:hypothetical protein
MEDLHVGVRIVVFREESQWSGEGLLVSDYPNLDESRWETLDPIGASTPFL